MLHDEIDRCFGRGPEHPPVEQRIAAGRRALRRRRAATALTAVSVVAVLGTTFAVTLPGQDGRATGELAGSPTPTPTSPATSTPSASKAASTPAEPWEPNLYARHTDDGSLEIRPGVEVHERIANPYGWAAPLRSDALDITWRGRRIWTIVELGRDGLAYMTASPSREWSDFGAWVADRAATMSDSTGRGDLLRLRDDGRVVAAGSAEILQRTDDPQLGEGFAPPGTRTGAALVSLTDGSADRFLFWRVFGDDLDVFTVAPGELVGATFPEMLAYARSLYTSGGDQR